MKSPRQSKDTFLLSGLRGEEEIPSCPKHGEMGIVNRGIEPPKDAWGNAAIYFEEYLCKECKFRLRQRYLVMDFGGAFKS